MGQAYRMRLLPLLLGLDIDDAFGLMFIVIVVVVVIVVDRVSSLKKDDRLGLSVVGDVEGES